MTLPDERIRAMLQARNLLWDLLDPEKTPKVSKDVRTRARAILRHYPTVLDSQMLAAGITDSFVVFEKIRKLD